MKSLKSFVIIAFLFIFATACSKSSEEVIPSKQSSLKSMSSKSEYDEEKLKIELENGLMSFVNSLRSEYSSEIDFATFKLNLIGNSNLTTITVEGNALLEKTYQLLSENSDEVTIKREGLKEFAQATLFAIKYVENNISDASAFDKAWVELFGGNEISLKDGSLKKPCKWYQVGCHLSNFWGWLGRNKENVIKGLEIALKVIEFFLKK
ncbi:MAG: hypothetical protein EAZ44_04640 [Cytophagia bacterium]|nr:MAG: hypothetical protein EAZ44_04640 [Cytophagia bacterium]TAG43390.1 MAG: hypothetical protein EAZ31_04365 [Cytophagia bacterium]